MTLEQRLVHLLGQKDIELLKAQMLIEELRARLAELKQVTEHPPA